jgi:hypothetical protein
VLVTLMLEPGSPLTVQAPSSTLVVFSTPATTDRDHDDDEGALFRYCKLEDMMGNAGAHVMAGDDIEQLHAISVEELESYTEAEQQEC